ncbi:MAG: hypothetical protein U0840_10920 [Gemmataceae bacterium]
MLRLFLLTVAAGTTLLALGEAAPTPEATETVVRLKVTPRAVPRPSLKYQLLPEVAELNPGNVIQGFLKCFMEQNHFFYNKEVVEAREKYQTMPLEDLPLKDLRGYGGAALRQADLAARLETVDWQVLLQLKREGIYLLLPEVQQLRMLASALKVRFRVEVAEGRFDDAVRTAKTMFALGRCLGEHPTIISGLVGLAISSLAQGPLEEMIGKPGAPNLFWALSNLPNPLIDLRKGAQGERVLILGSELPELADPEPMTAAQLDKIRKKLVALFKVSGDGPAEGVDAWLDAQVANAEKVKARRARLIKLGHDARQVERYLPLHVVLADDALLYEEIQDDQLKWMTQPFWLAEPHLVGTRTKNEHVLLPRLAGVFQRVKQAQTRFQQRMAMLTIVEAMRDHAATTGALPGKLTDIKLPVPVDPVTGRAFEYRLEDGKATLRGTPPRGFEKSAVYNVRYEISLRK